MKRRLSKELQEIAHVLAALAALFVVALYVYAVEDENQLLRQMYIDLRKDALAGKVK